ncbi:MAG: hypothetical protein MZW92_13700 [Comamonadaceae bacterium]|nr:hypothetical protein [Comamonadaceae bacterium]
MLIQTEYPEHPLLTQLITGGYDAFAAAALEEREQRRLAAVRAHRGAARRGGAARDAARRSSTRAREQAASLAGAEVEILGPATAPMERRAGLFRAQLLLHAPSHAPLQRLLARWLPVDRGPAGSAPRALVARRRSAGAVLTCRRARAWRTLCICVADRALAVAIRVDRVEAAGKCRAATRRPRLREMAPSPSLSAAVQRACASARLLAAHGFAMDVHLGGIELAVLVRVDRVETGRRDAGKPVPPRA